MASTYTNNVKLELQNPGENALTWGGLLNTAITQVDEAFGVYTVTLAYPGPTFVLTSGTTSEAARYAVLKLGGTPSLGPTMILPNVQRNWLVNNDSGQGVSIRTPTGSAISLSSGADAFVVCDGSNGMYFGLANLSADHGSLTGLGDDDHTQYLLADGTRALAGTWSLGGNDLTNAGDITFQAGATGGTIRTGTTAADKFQVQVYDTLGAAYVTVLEGDAGNPPVMQLIVDYFQFEDAAAPTKIAKFDSSALSVGTHTFTFPDGGGTLLVDADIGSSVQAQGAVLDDLNTLGAAASDGQFIVATGVGAFAYESGSTARDSLGLGTGNSPQFTDLTLTNDLLLASGGVINWNSGDVTLTHSSNALTLDGGTLINDYASGTSYLANTVLQGSTQQLGLALYSTSASYTNPFSTATASGFNTGSPVHADFTGGLFQWTAAGGGLAIMGNSDDSGVPAIVFNANQGVGSTTNSAMLFRAVESDGAGGIQAFGANETIFRFMNNAVDLLVIQSNLNQIVQNTIIGSNSVSPDGTLHVHTASAGAVTAATPADDLVIEGSGQTGLSILVPDAQPARIVAGAPSDNDFIRQSFNYNSGSPYIGFENGTVERIRFDMSAGRIGIGVTPSNPIHVAGVDNLYTANIKSGSTASQSFGMLLDAGTNSTDYAMRVRSNGATDYFAVKGDGKIGIGTTSPDALLDVNGQAAATEVRIGSETSNLDATVRLIEARASFAALGGYIRYDDGANGLVLGRNDVGATVNDTDVLFIPRGSTAVTIGGTTAPDGTLHVHTATAGAVTANASADEAVFENSTSGGISILGPASSVGTVAFGTPNNDDEGRVRYVHGATTNTGRLELIARDAIIATFQTGVQIGSPTGGDKGAGTLNAAGDIYKNNSAYTNPDYVLEHWATGKIEQFADKSGAAEHRGHYPLSWVEAYARDHLHLPGFGQEQDHGIFEGSDKLLAQVEHAYLHLFDHERRLAALEAKFNGNNTN